MSYPKSLEELTDKELFELARKMDDWVHQLCRIPSSRRTQGQETALMEDVERLREIDKEVARREEVEAYEVDLQAFENSAEYCCDQCEQIDKGEWGKRFKKKGAGGY
jgi:hypothetical protein